MKKILLILLIPALFFSCNSEEEDGKKKKRTLKDIQVPNIAWDDLFIADTVMINTDVQHAFVFISNGWYPVKIYEAVATTPYCDCVVPPNEVRVEQRDSIVVKCNFKTPGLHKFLTTITHNTPQRPFSVTSAIYVEKGE